MDLDFANAFARIWEADWNSHDLERILAHYGEEMVFTSPFAAERLGIEGGVVRGKQALRAYWAAGLAKLPDLRFEVLSVLLGTDTVVINYRNEQGRSVAEVLTFRDGLIVSGFAAYGPRPAD